MDPGGRGDKMVEMKGTAPFVAGRAFLEALDNRVLKEYNFFDVFYCYSLKKYVGLGAFCCEIDCDYTKRCGILLASMEEWEK